MVPDRYRVQTDDMQSYNRTLRGIAR